MSLAGEAVVVIWQEPRPEARLDYYEWHIREHMSERVGIAGFLRARRYAALEGQPRFFTLYEAENLAVLTGPQYRQRLDNPSPWTQRMIPQVLNNSRSLCRVALSLGAGQGGLLKTWRYDVADGSEETHRQFLERTLPALVERGGIAGVHLCIADRAASAVITEEKKPRLEKALSPGWVILVEGGSEAAHIEEASRALSAEKLADFGALPPVERGLYQLQFSVTAPPQRPAGFRSAPRGA
jgi:hypothetical protein